MEVQAAGSLMQKLEMALWNSVTVSIFDFDIPIESEYQIGISKCSLD